MGDDADGGITVDKISELSAKIGKFSPSEYELNAMISENKIDIEKFNKQVLFSEVIKKLTKLKKVSS